MKIGFVGAGKAGFTLGKYFKERGVDVTGYYSRESKSAKEAAVFTNTGCFESLGEILAVSEALFLTVPDSVIACVWNDLKVLSVRGKIICHCSGALSSDIFEGIGDGQAFGYSIHPLFAINSKLTSYQEISQAFFAIEGDEKYLGELKRLIEGLGNPVHIISAGQKIKYHAAAVFLSNHVTALAHLGSKLLFECGFEDEFIKIALRTLFLNHCKAIAEQGPVKALTGPVERNDLPTVKKHLQRLGKNEGGLYGYLSKQLIEIAKEKHPGLDYSAMEALIEKEMEVLV